MPPFPHITLDFIVKHVRPYTQAGYNALCTPGFSAQLQAAGMTVAEVNALFAIWQATALQNPLLNPQVFEQHALQTSTARIQTLFPILKSSVAFLTAAQMQDLDARAAQVGPGPVNNPLDDGLYNWEPPTTPVLVVNVDFTVNPATANLVTDAYGMTLANNTDATGCVVHFGGLL